ncbi:unnamed protein product [Musa textilis]
MEFLLSIMGFSLDLQKCICSASDESRYSTMSYPMCLGDDDTLRNEGVETPYGSTRPMSYISRLTIASCSCLICVKVGEAEFSVGSRFFAMSAPRKILTFFDSVGKPVLCIFLFLSLSARAHALQHFIYVSSSADALSLTLI